MSARAATESGLFLLALGVILGLAAVQSMGYLEDFVTFPQPPGVLYGTALVVGILLGWAFISVKVMLIAPMGVTLGAATVFFFVAYSPIWIGDSRNDVTVVNELLRQAALVIMLALVPIYAGSIGGFIARQMRQ